MSKADKDINQYVNSITRKCVHCGFCLATCPTYLLLGEEMNSPRGRVYLIKNIINGEKITKPIVNALDNCLLCRSCESTCPSGVNYHQLLDFARLRITTTYRRGLFEKFYRYLVVNFLTNKLLLKSAVNLAVLFKPVLPTRLSKILPEKVKAQPSQAKIMVKEKVLLLANCVQPTIAPNINHKTVSVLNKLNVEVALAEQCCAAIEQHLGLQQIALTRIKANIDLWYQKLTQEGYSYLVSNVSGCGLMIQDYPELLKNSQEYYQKAKLVSSKSLDLAQYLSSFNLSLFNTKSNKTLSLHLPCSLQHGQNDKHSIFNILEQLGFTVGFAPDSHLCCGSAGTYSIFQAKIASQLAEEKIAKLVLNKPDIIVSANIGCISHLQKHTDIKVCHWIELLDANISQ